MRTIAVSSVKNEIDIIEAFVRHTLKHVDELLVLDNGSTDGTLTVLRELRAEGLALDIIEDPSPGKFHALRSTSLMQKAAGSKHADWVVLLDADEFLSIPSGQRFPPAGADPGRPINLPWRTYVAHEGDDFNELNPVRRLRFRRSQEGVQWWKVVVPRALAVRPDARLTSGNHTLCLGEEVCDAVAATDGFLGHFPIRSPGQYQAKTVINYLQYQTMADRKVDWGWHYRTAFAELKRDRKGFAAAYREASLQYAIPPEQQKPLPIVLDPLDYRGDALRHTPRLDDDTIAWNALLEFAERLAVKYATLSASLDNDGELSLARQTALVQELHGQLSRQYSTGIELGHQNAQLTEMVHKLTHQYGELVTSFQDQQLEWNRCREQWENGRQRWDADQQKLEGQRRQLDIQRQRWENQEQQWESHEQQWASQERQWATQRQQWETQRHQIQLITERQHYLAAALQAAHQSWTWKVGRLAIGPLRWLREQCTFKRTNRSRLPGGTG